MARKYRINIEGEERVVEVLEHGEKNYLITLDGKSYQTHIEDVAGSGSEVTQPKITVSPASVPASAGRASESKLSLQKPSAAAADGTTHIVAPLTGTVRSIKVASGAKVERGHVLCLLEAMKMEIEVTASHDGVIHTVAVKHSDTVQTGAVLFVLQVNAGQ
jgi:glutaconyl-CoA/methylmalonyl-CoA decarboxylase subunit gamma